MKGQPIHQDMSTSFVNFSALVNYLRRVGFTGSVRLEHSSYEAEIIFTPKNRLQAREYDRLAGRITQGERAFNGILRRSREPHGRIHVVRANAEDAIKYIKKPFVDDRIAATAMQTVTGRSNKRVAGTVLGETWLAFRSDDTEKAVMLASELLAIVSDGFVRAEIDFDASFRMACSILSSEHWFLDLRRKRFVFEDRKLSLFSPIGSQDLFDGLIAVIKHFIERLTESGRFEALIAQMRSDIGEHLKARRGDYEKMSIAGQIEMLI